MHVTLVMAMSADGKIAPVSRERHYFGDADARRLERLCAEVDALVMGAGTLRAGGTTRTISQPELLARRRAARRPPQPLTCIVSGSADLDLDMPFFRRQEVPRAIATTRSGAAANGDRYNGLAEIWECGEERVEVAQVLERLEGRSVGALALLGGGDLSADWFAAEAVDQIQLTVAPVLLGGATAPTPIDGPGLDCGRRLILSEVDEAEGCLFLTYRVIR